MKTRHIALVASLIPVLLAGCVSNPTSLATVGPDTRGRLQAGPDGYLQVYTATETVEVDFKTDFHPHMGYSINDPTGKSSKFVANHTSDLDESPDKVELPPGNYTIVAESTWQGLVSVPVVISKGRTTVVRLDDNG